MAFFVAAVKALIEGKEDTEREIVRGRVETAPEGPKGGFLK